MKGGERKPIHHGTSSFPKSRTQHPPRPLEIELPALYLPFMAVIHSGLSPHSSLVAQLHHSPWSSGRGHASCLSFREAWPWVGDPQRLWADLYSVPLCSIFPAPGPPSFLEFSEITSTTLNVSWGEPSAANGILQGYRVVYEPLAPVQGKAGVGDGAQ